MSIEHTDVAAYSLGLLDAKDREDFEAHLATCPACAAELAEFAAMAELFADVGPVEVPGEPPDEAVIVDFVSRRAKAVRRRSRQWFGLAVAASLVLIGGGVAAGIASAPGPPFGTPHSASNPTTHVTGTVGLLSELWGTQVTLRLSLPVTHPLKCQLVAVPKIGKPRVVVGWLVPYPGYGVSGHPADLLVEGGTWFKKQALSRFEIQAVHGTTLQTLLTIPV